MIHKAAIRMFEWLFPHPSQGRRETFCLSSQHVGDELEIWVDLPGLPADQLHNLPVLVYCDANLPTSRRLNPIVRELREKGELPPMLLVGIAHHDSLLLKRNRDYVYGKKLRNGKWAGKRKGFAQADAFVDFINLELAPAIRDRYSVSESWTLMGHSLAGSFTLFAMLRENSVFSNYIALSPAVWTHRRVLFKIAEHHLSQGGEIKGNVYFSAGSLEAANMVLFSARAYFYWLKGREDEELKVRMDEFPWRNHFNSVKPAIRQALNWLAANEAFSTLEGEKVTRYVGTLKTDALIAS